MLRILPVFTISRFHGRRHCGCARPSRALARRGLQSRRLNEPTLEARKAPAITNGSRRKNTSSLHASYWVKLMVLSMSWNLGNVLARNRHVHRSIFRRRNGSRIVCWLFDLSCGLRLLCLRLWHSNGAWARMVAFWNFGCGRGVVCHGCMARPCCSHRHHVLFVFRSKLRAKAAQS